MRIAFKSVGAPSQFSGGLIQLSNVPTKVAARALNMIGIPKKLTDSMIRTLA